MISWDFLIKDGIYSYHKTAIMTKVRIHIKKIVMKKLTMALSVVLLVLPMISRGVTTNKVNDEMMTTMCEHHAANFLEVTSFVFACMYDKQVGWGDDEQQALENLSAQVQTDCENVSEDEMDKIAEKLLQKHPWRAWQNLDFDATDVRAKYCHAINPMMKNIINQYQ